MDKRYRFRQIKAIELLNLPPESDERSYYLKIFARDVSKKTKAYKVKKNDHRTTLTPRWTLDLDLRGINESERFQVEVYCRRGKGEYQCLGLCGGSMQDILIGEADNIAMSISSNSSCPNVSLKIVREGASDYNAIMQSASEDQDMSAAPQSGPSNFMDLENQGTSDVSRLQPEGASAMSVEDYHATAKEAVKGTVKPNEPSEWMSRLIDGIDIVKSVIDAFTSAHPAASVAWAIISPCVDILKKGIERDDTICRLYEAMIMTYKEASNYCQLWREKRLQPIYKALFQTTSDCGTFIRRYTTKSRIKRFLSPKVSPKAEELIQRFAKLRNQLVLGVAQDTLVATLDVRANVGTLAMKTLLEGLKPNRELGPKSTCIPGTRKETIKYLLTWITDCDSDNTVLWCSGLAGTGKSSLVGTLYNLLCFHTTSHRQLAAFLRYDRTLYRDSSGLIMSIAYSLGKFDHRIGNAIIQALTTFPDAAKLPASESYTQFRLLLQEPLETIPELHDEEPLVVIIDGLDESDVSKELLEVLADGFGPELLFMRLIISSHPEEKIARVLKDHPHFHHYRLDTSSNEVKQDIWYFIQQRFASIDDESVWGTHNKDDVITSLAKQASGLFIWAATVCLFLCNFPSLRRLEVLLNTVIPTDATEALMILYQTALDTITSEVSGEDVQKCICAVLGALIVHKGKVTVPMLPELVLQQGDPPMQLIVAHLGSVIQERLDGSLEFIHKSFDNFLQDYGRCGDRWFIDVKEHEQKLAQWCVLSLTMFLANWAPISASAHLKEAQFQPQDTVLFDDNNFTIVKDYSNIYPMQVLPLYDDVPAHIRDYAVNVLEWHLDAFIDLGIDTYRPLFDCYFLVWLEVLYAFGLQLWDKAFFKVISVINAAEVKDQNLRTYVYHAFTFWNRFTQFSMKYHQVNPAYVYTYAMSISPSENVICRDWGQSSGMNTPFSKEHLLAFTYWGRASLNLDSVLHGWNMVQGSQHIQSEYINFPSKRTTCMPVSQGSILFNVDTGKIVNPSPSSILLYFPDLQLPPFYDASTHYKSINASIQVVRLVCWNTWYRDRQCTFNGTYYESIERHYSDPQEAMISNVEHIDNSHCMNRQSMFISIVDTQTSHCNNYLIPTIGEDSHVVQYAHGLIVIDECLGLMLNIDPHTTGCKKWITMDGGANGVNEFAVMEDESMLLGLMGAAAKISLQKWETSTGTLCTRTYGRSWSLSSITILTIRNTTGHSDFRPSGYFGCQISPDGSKATISPRGWPKTYMLGITSESSANIMDLKDARKVTWFPDSKRIAYIQSWQCEHRVCDECCDLVVQCLLSRKITIIHHWYLPYIGPTNIMITSDGSRVITVSHRRSRNQFEFKTWDVSDL